MVIFLLYMTNLSFRTDHERKLYELMVEKGYPGDFAAIVAGQMHTEYTAERMCAFIRRAGLLKPEEIADEMLSILSERDRLVRKHISEHAQKKLNEYYNLPEEDE